ncbi:MAG: hypothetical protein MI919_23435 [Holophagales bacterium]|nr:hypothetical protein [Holophagales bacterium]
MYRKARNPFSGLLFVLVLLIAAAAAVPALAEEEMTVDEIIAKNIETKGGAEAWEKVENAKLSGTMNMGGGMLAPTTLYFQRPEKVRIEFELQGNKIVQAYDGETGWQIMPLMGKPDPQRMNDAELDQIKDLADFEGPLFNYEEKGHKVKLTGKEEVEGTMAYKIQVDLENGDVHHYFLDSEYFLEFKSKQIRSVQGQEVSVDITLGDYKEVGGVLINHSIEVTPEGAPAGMVMTFDTVEVNSDEVSDALFTMPEAKEPASEGTEG